MDKLTLPDGREVTLLNAEEKEAFETDMQEVLDKHKVMYLPVIQQTQSMFGNTQMPALFVVKEQHDQENRTTEEGQTAQAEGEGVREEVSEE